ncbi:MAG TPA: ABC transporter substrate-binding protein [Burkholderiaceae bacterium]|nr:ABC transporter substrate-binding protein [Burkholderiaceae bacterium]HQR70674.1 ABC transporter substrate-binding protein [Burkholderiaceae bacterium]
MVVTALLAGLGPVQAATLRMANQGDPLSLDPHSLNETLQLTILSNVYEGLVGYGKDLKIVPLLATDWKQTAPTVWRFNLRKGVRFHDGSSFTADDVIFSYERARADGSDMKAYVGSVKEVRKVDDYAVDFVTDTPNPILPNMFGRWLIMSKKWCVENKAERPVDKRKGIENVASFKANGTGPFRVKSRDPGNRTVLVRNTGYWDKLETNIDEVIFTPIANPSTRVAALISGEIDMMEPVPVQDVARINATGSATVLQGPELRTIFLGMDQKRDELLFSNVKGKNPFKDRRVRQAFFQAIDIDAIKNQVMRGAATPAGLMEAPGVSGFPADLNKRLPYDPEGAKKLLADAGYPNGFEVGMNCPNDRYVNDAAICTAVSAMLARIGVKVNLMAESKATYFPKILSRNTSFYLLGWTPSTVDSHDPLYSLMATPGAGGQGQFNLGSYSNPRLDELTGKIQSETDQAKRNAMIHEAMKIHQDDVGHIPLHQQALAWGVKKNLSLVQLPSNDIFVKWMVLK